MKLEGFQDLYLAELQEAHSAESLQGSILARMAEAATSDDLKSVLRKEAEESKSERQRLEGILGAHGAEIEAHEDQAVRAIVDECEKMIEGVTQPKLRDAAMIASAQRLKHYEIAVYGTLTDYAKCLGFEDDQKTLHDILESEKAADVTLSDIAESTVNPEAAQETAFR